MLSNNAYKLLKWLSKQDRWMSTSEIKQEYKRFDDRVFKAASEKYLEKRMDLDGTSWAEYRINDLGKAYLDGAKLTKQSTIREWIALILSGIAIVISIVK